MALTVGRGGLRLLGVRAPTQMLHSSLFLRGSCASPWDGSNGVATIVGPHDYPIPRGGGGSRRRVAWHLLMARSHE